MVFDVFKTNLRNSLHAIKNRVSNIVIKLVLADIIAAIHRNVRLLLVSKETEHVARKLDTLLYLLNYLSNFPFSKNSAR